MRDLLIGAARTYYTGMINKHISNVEVLLTNPTGIGDHQDTQAAMESELGKISEYNGKLDALMRYFTKPTKEETTEEKTKK